MRVFDIWADDPLRRLALLLLNPKFLVYIAASEITGDFFSCTGIHSAVSEPSCRVKNSEETKSSRIVKTSTIL
jgi:hypothetical protein